MTQRVYNLKRDDPNHPDKTLLMLAVPEHPLPVKAATSQWMGKTRDQGDEGSCSGQLKAEVRDWLYRKFYPFEKNKAVAPADFMASASFAYKTNLIADGDLGQDAGSTIHTTYQTLNQLGVCLELQEPYSDNDYTMAPTAEQYAEALVYKGGPYHAVPDLYTIKSCIASGYSVGGGIDVYPSFETEHFSNSGMMPLPQPSESLVGRHAQHFLDYDDTVKFLAALGKVVSGPSYSGPSIAAVRGLFVQNSWGSEWGISAPGRSDRGCYWMPQAYVEQGHVTDMWTMHLGPTWK